jgi:hypothetical protein
VRGDPVRRGLLFAATERGVYVSFDEGDHWQSLRLNLPPSSVRDLTVHGDDLVAGTHGRSFWVLDDISSLRQLDGRLASAGAGAGAAAGPAAHLFQPAVAYRVRRDLNTDTPLPPEEPAGRNPPDGAVIEYLLRAPAAGSGPVALEIADAAGHLVRRFSSADRPKPVDPKTLPIPTYWIRPELQLPADAGMHRFVWDLRYPPPDALRHEYPISAVVHDTPPEPLGPYALPGQYQVKLTVGGKTLTQPLTVKMDPRVLTPAEGLAQQLKLASGIAEAMRQDAAALREVKALRGSLAKLVATAREKRLGKDVMDEMAAVSAKAATLAEGGQGEGGAPPAAPGAGVRRRAAATTDLTQLNEDLAGLLMVVNNTDEVPTTQAQVAGVDLEGRLAGLLGRWRELRGTDLAKLNAGLKRAGLPPVEVAAPER